MKSGGEKREKKDNKPYFVVFYKVHKSCPLYFHRLPLSVVESQNKVEEIGFPQVGGWLLFKVSSGQSYSAVEETHGIGCGGRDKDITNPCSSTTSKTTSGHGRRDSGRSPGRSAGCRCRSRSPPVPCHRRRCPNLQPLVPARPRAGWLHSEGKKNKAPGSER